MKNVIIYHKKAPWTIYYFESRKFDILYNFNSILWILNNESTKESQYGCVTNLIWVLPFVFRFNSIELLLIVSNEFIIVIIKRFLSA